MARVCDELRQRLEAASVDPEAVAMSAGLEVRVCFAVGEDRLDLSISGGALNLTSDTASADITIAAAAEDWALVLQNAPPPGFHSFAALQLRNPRFDVSGDGLVVAQARACLEALIEALRPRVHRQVPCDLTPLCARYHRVTAQGRQADIFTEFAGVGPPLLCLHTAGADSRQFHGLLGSDLTQTWRLTAFDLPFHGRSLPPDDWDGGTYRLDQRTYCDWCAAFIEQTIGEPVVVLGCSMGAGIALVLAAERPDLVRAVIGVETPLRPRGRRNSFLTHARVHGGWHASAYVRGLMSPLSPAGQRRRAAWIYAQGGPGIYDGDLMFYSDEFDGETVAKTIDGRRTPVTLMIGHYDFSATVDDAHALAGWIEGARVIEMGELGHFPMIENPPVFLDYLRPVLSELRTDAAWVQSS
ncbi:MAG: alpha/beta fold hydrolase [Xanthobacteraceae bacterium]